MFEIFIDKSIGSCGSLICIRCCSIKTLNFGLTTSIVNQLIFCSIFEYESRIHVRMKKKMFGQTSWLTQSMAISMAIHHHGLHLSWDSSNNPNQTFFSYHRWLISPINELDSELERSLPMIWGGKMTNLSSIFLLPFDPLSSSSFRVESFAFSVESAVPFSSSPSFSFCDDSFKSSAFFPLSSGSPEPPDDVLAESFPILSLLSVCAKKFYHSFFFFGLKSKNIFFVVAVVVVWGFWLWFYLGRRPIWYLFICSGSTSTFSSDSKSSIDSLFFE